MNNSSYIHILFFALTLPRANDVDVESFVALFFVLVLDLFFSFLILLFIMRAAVVQVTNAHAFYKMIMNVYLVVAFFYLFFSYFLSFQMKKQNNEFISRKFEFTVLIVSYGSHQNRVLYTMQCHMYSMYKEFDV